MLLIVEKQYLHDELQTRGVIEVEPQFPDHVLLNHCDHFLAVSVAALVIPLLLCQNHVFVHFDSQHQSHDTDQLVNLNCHIFILHHVFIHVDYCH